MAPEVLANQRYSHRADVYSFGVVMWECCSRQLPYEGLNGVQAALAVMSKGMRPSIPERTPPALAALITACWAPVPEQRPPFTVVVERLEQILAELRQQQQQHVASGTSLPMTASPLPGAATAGTAVAEREEEEERGRCTGTI
jgi:serine/threonine protein kinase